MFDFFGLILRIIPTYSTYLGHTQKGRRILGKAHVRKTFKHSMKIIIPLFLFISFAVHGQQDPVLEADKKQYLEDVEKNKKWESDELKFLKESEKILEDAQTELETLNFMEKNKTQIKDKVSKDIQARLDAMSVTQKMLGKKAAFYKCIRDDLKYRGFSKVADCKLSHKADFTPEEEQQIKDWNAMVGKSPQQIKFAKEQAAWSVKQREGFITESKKRLKNIEAMKVQLRDREIGLEMRENEGAMVRKDHASILNCDANTPEVSLEAEVPYPGAKFKGPFVGVPRDNQDGLGTCYANTAKNLLVSTSQGKDIASFLDLALVYKGRSGVVASALDGGNSCDVLKRMEDKGYCPQDHSPYETGSKNLYTDGIFNGNNSLESQAYTIRLLHDFVAGVDLFTRQNKGLSEKTLKKVSLIIDTIKKQPNVKLPLPIVRFQIPSDWKLKEFAAQAQNHNPLFDGEKFERAFKDNYRNFYPKYLRAVVAGKGREEIFAEYKNVMKPFIDTYQLEGQLSVWEKVFMNSTEHEIKSPDLKKDITDSLKFLKTISGNLSKTDEEFLQYCDETFGDNFHFIENMQPLIKHLGDINIDAKILFDKNGNVKAPEEIMQLAVAPACLNSGARKYPVKKIYCDYGTGNINKIKSSGKPRNEQIKMVRERVVASLVQGYALGNSFDRHINTIVGMRFNKDSRQCEYQIRESQNGKTLWQEESGIFDRMDSLAEVRRK